MSERPMPILIRYDLQSLRINNVGISGIQNVSVSQTRDVTSIPTRGNPFVSKVMYKKPNVEVTFTKFLSDNVASLVIDSGLVNATRYKSVFPSGKLIPAPLDINIDIYDYVNPNNISPSGLEIKDALLKSINYTFGTNGFFTENIGFSSHVLLSSGIKYTVKPYEDNNFIPHTGTVKRRQDFYISGVPAEVAAHLSSGHALLSADVSISIDYGDIPSYGRFFSVMNKYVRYPIDVTCSFEVLDRGYYKDSGNIYSSDKFRELPYITGLQFSDPYIPILLNGVEVTGSIIKGKAPSPAEIVNSVYEQLTATGIILGIKDVLKIDLGNNNFLVSRERSGGDAGQSNYSVYKYTYKNTTSEFNISSG
jgi:hypothetical protein